MSDNVTELPAPKAWEVEFGPKRSGFDVIVEGRLIPHLHAHDRGEIIDFVLDGRLCYEVPREVSGLFAEAIAQAMAIGAGYPWLGAASKDRPFAPEIRELGGLP